MLRRVTNTKILVTGGAGFIGSHVVEALTEKHKVTILDNLGMKPAYINPKAKLVKGGISKIRKIGYEPKVNMEEAMKETISWVSTQKAEDKFEQAYIEYEEKKLVR